MSQLIINTVQLTNFRPHPNADRLELADAGAWQVVLPKDRYKEGSTVVFIPPDAVIEENLHKEWGVTNYLAQIPDDYIHAGVGARRVIAARLRGQPSYGLVVDIPDFQYPDEAREFFEDIAHYWGITKWEPPVDVNHGDMESNHPLFHKYTDIERYQNFPDIIPDGEMVVFTEKIHGRNCRVGMIPVQDATGNITPTLMAGSHSCRRKKFDAEGKFSLYWTPTNNTNLIVMLEALWKKYHQPIVVFGEIFGAGVNDMSYGMQGKHFRVFDISIGGGYVNYQVKRQLCEKYGVQMVPILYRGPMSKEVVLHHTDGPTKAGNPTGKFKGREGIVITPEVERHNSTIGRVILKSVSVDYLERKGAVDTK